MSTPRKVHVDLAGRAYDIHIGRNLLAGAGAAIASATGVRGCLIVTDEIVDSFSILGSVDEHIAKLKELEAAGVDQFALYLMCGEEERNLKEYAENILPHFAKSAAHA